MGKIDNMEFDYDAVNDVMYCSIGGNPQEAFSVENAEGVFLRVNPETMAVVGFTITNFRTRFTNHPGQNVSVPMHLEAAAC